MKRLYCTLFFLSLASLAIASTPRWDVVNRRVEGSLPGGALLKSVTLQEPINKRERAGDGAMTAIVTAVVFQEDTYELQVIDNPERDKTLEHVMQERHLLAGINGAYFHPDGRPLGLMISQGKMVHGQENARLLSGFLFIERSRLQLLHSREKIPQAAVGALQAGPFLIDHQLPVVGLEATRTARRTFVATDGHGRWIIGVISPVTLDQAASILLAASPIFFSTHPIERALNLDGGSSSALWVARSPEPFSQQEIGMVRNFLGLTIKN